MIQTEAEKMKKAKDFKITPDDAHKISLTIVQDFPKKKVDSTGIGSHNVEMIQK